MSASMVDGFFELTHHLLLWAVVYKLIVTIGRVNKLEALAKRPSCKLPDDNPCPRAT